MPVPPVDGSFHIMIIEDDAAIGDMLTLLLEFEGYRVTWCSSASAALALLTSATPDAPRGLAAPFPTLIILDLELGADSGVALMQRIAAATRVVPPIIVVSGVDGVTARAAATTVGAVAVLRKPFMPADLLTAITTALPDADAAPDLDPR